MAVIDFFDRGWRLNPDGAAYVMGEERWTYAEAGSLSCHLAWALGTAEEITADAKVAVLSPNCPLAMIALLGIWRADLTWVPLNAANPVGDQINLLGRFDCSVLLFHSSQRDVVARVRRELPAVTVFVCLDEEVDELPSLRQWVATQPATRPPHRGDPAATVAIMPTGGTTGPSKGAMLTNRSLTSAVAHMLMALQYRADEPIVNLAAAPITHTAGLLSLPTVARGGTVVILGRPEPAAVIDAIRDRGVTELFLPPTVIYRLLDAVGDEAPGFPALKYLLYGAAPMSTEKLHRALEVFGPVMIGGYGQVEAFAAVAYLRPEEHFVDGRIAHASRLSSCGRPYPLIDLRIVADDGIDCETGLPGEICLRGDLVMAGYYRNPDKTATTIIDGWLHTGDVGFLDADGYLHITDRKTDMIITGGFNVYPAEVEQVIWSHPAVMDCAVIGVPDPDWGEAVTAVVELNSGATASGDELRALCRERLGPVRTPKRVEFVDALPRSNNGKVLKREVRALFSPTLARQT